MMKQLKKLWGWWIKLGELLAFINTRIILALMFFLILTPLGFFLKLTGKKLLGDGQWQDHGRVDKEQYTKQY